MSASSISIAREPLEADDSRRLIAALDAELSALYPPDQTFFDLNPEQASGDRGAFLVVRVDGLAAGCGAIRLLDQDSAELKRMYVAVPHRRRGLSRRLLTALEQTAAELGATRLVLETGNRQAAALALYTGAGYRPIPCFGAYARSPSSICLAKALDR